MSIDKISHQLFKLALYLDKKVPGIVSEIWIDESTVNEIKTNLSTAETINAEIEKTYTLLNSVSDERRKSYLRSLVDSIKFQIETLSEQPTYNVFTKNAFDFEIQRVTASDLDFIEAKLAKIEEELGRSRFEVYKENTLTSGEYRSYFQKSVEEIKARLPEDLLNFPDEGFELELTSNKPWSAFNSHIAPFRSKLTLNTDISFSRMDLHRLASHEAYGGHHSELCNKDRLLVDESRGEHGLVITFSPQTFVSEAIAEGIYVILEILDETDPIFKLGWYYDRLTFALQNLATFMFFDDHMSKDEIIKALSNYRVTEKTRGYIVNFATDPLFGKYAPVYYSAFNFVKQLYDQTENKSSLINTLFTQPCTPALLTSEYSKKH